VLRRLPHITFLLALAATLAGALAAPAPAATGPCIVGDPGSPACRVWTGKVATVHDGDTMSIAVKGDGRTGLVRVRLTGVQAMEQTVYSSYASRRRGECHALAATARASGLVRRARGRVRLAAQDERSHSGHRVRRSVAVRLGGRWVDLGRILIGEGHALWLTNPVENAWNRQYHALAEQAAAAGKRLWNPQSCGAGPSAGAALRLRLNWDADGSDFENPADEWMRIVNDGGSAVPLGGWWVRDSALRRYRIPAGTVVAPGGAVTVHVGRGQDGGGHFFWGLAEPAFENASYDQRGIGDGAYLFDPQGDLRAWEMYPSRDDLGFDG